MNYADFLAAKQQRHGEFGRDCAAGDVNPMLHDWQREGVTWAVRKGRAALWWSTGLGKSRAQIEWARLSGPRSLIVAPLAVCQQTVREGAAIGMPVTYVRGDADAVGPGIWITNYEMVERFDPARLDAVVIDECFAAGTEIDTPEGRKHIEDVRLGDEILNAAGVDLIADVHRREVPYAVHVAFAGRTVLSSPNHPYFTQRGWVAAQDLEPGDALVTTTEAVRMVRESLPQEIGYPATPEPILRSVLLSEMADEPAGAQSQGAYAGGGRQAWREEACMAGVRIGAGSGRDRADQATKPDQGSSGAGKDLPHIESHAPRTFRAWGQWPWLDRAAAASAGCAWVELAGGMRHIVGPTDTWLSDALQTRLGVARAASRYRGGWQLSPQPEGAGRQEGRETRFTRVDGVEVLEPGDPRLARLRDANGRLYFYDLGATRHPSFSVAGHLVHNSSILKQSTGKTRTMLIRHFAPVPARLSCTATPAPNDAEELTNQAEFLGVMPRAEVLASFFINDQKTQGYRLKGHARLPFYRWLATWAMALRVPSDIGGDDTGYILPPLHIVPEIVQVDVAAGDGELFRADIGGVGGRAEVRRETLAERVQRTVELVKAEPDEQWILWTGLNLEADALAKALPGSVNVMGAWTPEEKAAAYLGFADGSIRYLVTKPSMAALGLNLQCCARMAFVGMNDSYELWFQAIRRAWRYGQTREVYVHAVLSQLESQIAANVQRKGRQADRLVDGMVAAMRDQWKGIGR